MYRLYSLSTYIFFFFNDTATTEIYTLSLHDALPISLDRGGAPVLGKQRTVHVDASLRRHIQDDGGQNPAEGRRSEEHTSELQSQSNRVCRLLLEKKKNTSDTHDNIIQA